MAQLAERFVGRAEELESLADLVARLGDGRASAIDFVGEPGIGKSRLLGELAALAGAHRYVVLTGSASEFERDVPFGVFVDALDEFVRGLDPGRLERLGEDVRSELGSVLPSFARFGNGHVATLQHERYRAHRATRALLEMLAATTPLVLVLDDVHWADSASVELLGALLHRLPSASVLIAMAGRQRQLPERLAVSLERARRAGNARPAELGALSRAETKALLGAAVADAEVTTLFEESGGNPFYLEQLAAPAHARRARHDPGARRAWLTSGSRRASRRP